MYAFPQTDPLLENIDEKALFVRNPYTSMKGVRTHFPSSASFPETDKSQVIDPGTDHRPDRPLATGRPPAMGSSTRRVDHPAHGSAIDRSQHPPCSRGRAWIREQQV